MHRRLLTSLVFLASAAGSRAAAVPEMSCGLETFDTACGIFRPAPWTSRPEAAGARPRGAYSGERREPAAMLEPEQRLRADSRAVGFLAHTWSDEDGREPGGRDRGADWGGRSRHFSWNEDRWQEAECDGAWIGFFAQCGWAPGDRREAARLEGGGVTLLGIIPERDADALGVGYLHVEFADKTRRPRDCASAIETFYKVQICDWLSLRPDFQVLVRPSGFARDSVVFGLRAMISL